MPETFNVSQLNGNKKGLLPLSGSQPFPKAWKVLAWGSVVFLLCLFSYRHLDRPVAMAVKTLPPGIAVFFSWITLFGKSTAYLIISGFGFFILYLVSRSEKWQKLRTLAWVFLFIFLAVGASGLLVDTLKVIFSRYRPNMLYKTGAYGFAFFKFTQFRWSLSFPSGHADTIFALMTALSLITRRYRFLYFSFAVLVAISRVLVGAHFISDILAGSYLGIVTTLYLKGFFMEKGIDIFSWKPPDNSVP